MKKTLIAMAVLAASGASFAQSSVSLYGVVDLWMGRTTATGAPSQTKLDAGGISSNRFGFKGSEDLGGGLKANFLLEQGFSADTGAAKDATLMFSRQSYVGFSGGFGEVKLGRMWTAYDDISGAANAVFDSAFTPQNNIWASVNYNANPNNGVYYATPSLGGLSGAVSYAFGENKAATVSAGSVIAAHVKYEAGPLFAGLGYQTEKATGSAVSTDYARLNAAYDLGMVKVLAGFGRVETGANRTNDWGIGLDYPVSGALTLSAGYARSNDNAAAGDAGRKGYGLGASYSLSKRTSVYGGYQSNTTTSAAGVDSDASLFAVGVRHAF